MSFHQRVTSIRRAGVCRHQPGEDISARGARSLAQAQFKLVGVEAFIAPYLHELLQNSLFRFFNNGAHPVVNLSFGISESIEEISGLDNAAGALALGIGSCV